MGTAGPGSDFVFEGCDILYIIQTIKTGGGAAFFFVQTNGTKIVR